MLKIAEIQNVRTVNIEGRTFFGMYKQVEGGAIIEKSLDITDRTLNGNLYLDYILKENVGNLNKNLTIEGAYVAAVQELNDEQMFEFGETLNSALHLAAKANKSIQNDFVKKNI